MLDQCQSVEFQVLSRRDQFGVVAQCPHGCIHICVGNTALRLTTDQYWKMMELLAEAAQQIAGRDVSRQNTQELIQ